MKRFENFKPTSRPVIPKPTSGNLRKGLPDKFSGVRKPLVDDVYERALSGESMNITGYSGCGKSTLMKDLLLRGIDDDMAGLGVILDVEKPDMLQNPDQFFEVYHLIKGGHKPKFFLIDEASESVTQLRHFMRNKLGTNRPLALLLEILAILPDSTALVLSYPTMHTEHIQDPAIPLRISQMVSRERHMEFYGGGSSKIVVPSSFSICDMTAILELHLSDQPNLGTVAEMLGKQIGLYCDHVSSFLLKPFLKLPHAEVIPMITKQDAFLFDAGKAIFQGHVTPLAHDLALAKKILDGIDVKSEEDVKRLREHGIIMEGAQFAGKDSLTYRCISAVAD